MTIEHWVVSAKEEGMPLLSFLREKLPKAPSIRAIKRAIDGKQCKVNNRIEVFSSHPLNKGDKISFIATFEKPAELSLPILYEDKEFLIVNKPAGLTCENRNINSKLPQYKNQLRLVHRLDKETSGAIILAKTAKMEELFYPLFAERKVHKIYLALVDGEVEKDEGKMDNYLGKKSQYQGQTVYGVVEKNKGQHAMTFWKCVSRGQNASLMLLEPVTGRTHQLRVQLSHIGHPILGDAQYGKKFRCKLMPARHLLHAYGIVFNHPMTQKEIRITAPIPKDFKEALEQLKAYPENLL